MAANDILALASTYLAGQRHIHGSRSTDLLGLLKRVAGGELTVYTDATRPTAAAASGRLIWNSTEGTLQYSNGTSWSAVAGASDGAKKVRAATTGALAGGVWVYNNTAGTLTAPAVGAFPAQDGVTLTVLQRLLVKNQGGGATHLQNGLYDLTTVGDGSTKAVLTRTQDSDESGDFSDMMLVAIQEGTTQHDQIWALTTAGPIVLGTTALGFELFGAVIGGTPVDVTKAAASAGTAATPARSDHKHDISTAAPAATGVATAAAEGSATSLARSDHAHISNTAPADVTKAAAAIGTSGEPARADHKHDVSTAAPGATGVATAAAEGSATSLARSDHAHISNTAPADVTKAAAAIGTSGEPARADHKHDISTAAPAATGVATAAAEGSATSLARSDHAHISNTAPADVTKAAAAIGTSGEPARADHKHDVSTAAPAATGVATAAAEGTATSLARSDHAHISNTAPANVTEAPAAIGTSGEPARADHKHNVGSSFLARLAEVGMDVSVATPTATEARGYVVGTGAELQVLPQAAPDLTIRITTPGRTYSHLGSQRDVAAVVSLGGFDDPGAGNQSYDIVVVDAAGAVVLRAGTPAAAPTDPVLTPDDVPLARVILQDGAATVTAAEIFDLRSRQPMGAYLSRNKGCCESVVLDLTTLPTNGDTVTVGAQVFEFRDNTPPTGGTAGRTWIYRGVGVADSRTNFINAVNGVIDAATIGGTPTVEPAFAESLGGALILIGSAAGPGLDPVARDDGTAVASSLTAVAPPNDMLDAAAMYGGRVESDCLWGQTTVTLDATIIAAGGLRIAWPFKVGGVQIVNRSRPNVEAVTIATFHTFLVLAGGGAPNNTAGDVLDIIAWSRP